ncbi:MAG: tetratricopeptide repeat protein [Deltaproteobacteria bacterium]|nr:tetratricopeptide repeat protein [Deltaproteobacteria bacterium]MCB9786501.1 tetratricopeptide repeat protein [Deltaproteobacteria bacterium]
MAEHARHVIDVTEATFNDEVVHRSSRTPVIIDLWATWCGPCKTLGPILEGMAAEYGGAFVLAKVDVDQNPMLAQSMGAQSIPMVLAVFEGGIVDQFVGALPRADVKRFIDRVLERCGVSVAEAEDAPKAPSDPAEAEAFWKARVAKDAADGAALLQLGRLYLAGERGDEAREVLTRITATMPEYNAAQAALSLGSLWAEVQAAGGVDALAKRLRDAPEDGEARYLMALADSVHGRFVQGLQALVGLVGSARGELRDKARSAAATVLEAAGRDDEQVEKLRRKLASLVLV